MGLEHIRPLEGRFFRESDEVKGKKIQSFCNCNFQVKKDLAVRQN